MMPKTELRHFAYGGNAHGRTYVLPASRFLVCVRFLLSADFKKQMHRKVPKLKKLHQGSFWYDAKNGIEALCLLRHRSLPY